LPFAARGNRCKNKRKNRTSQFYPSVRATAAADFHPSLVVAVIVGAALVGISTPAGVSARLEPN